MIIKPVTVELIQSVLDGKAKRNNKNSQGYTNW